MIIFAILGIAVAMVATVDYINLFCKRSSLTSPELFVLEHRDDRGRVYFHRDEIIAKLPDLQDNEGNRLFYTEDQLINQLLEENK